MRIKHEANRISLGSWRGRGHRLAGAVLGRILQISIVELRGRTSLQCRRGLPMTMKDRRPTSEKSTEIPGVHSFAVVADSQPHPPRGLPMPWERHGS